MSRDGNAGGGAELPKKRVILSGAEVGQRAEHSRRISNYFPLETPTRRKSERSFDCIPPHLLARPPAPTCRLRLLGPRGTPLRMTVGGMGHAPTA